MLPKSKVSGAIVTTAMVTVGAEGVTGGVPAVATTVALAVEAPPLLSPTVKRTVYVPVAAYVWVDAAPDALVPSPWSR